MNIFVSKKLYAKWVHFWIKECIGRKLRWKIENKEKKKCKVKSDMFNVILGKLFSQFSSFFKEKLSLPKWLCLRNCWTIQSKAWNTYKFSPTDQEQREFAGKELKIYGCIDVHSNESEKTSDSIRTCFFDIARPYSIYFLHVGVCCFTQ